MLLSPSDLPKRGSHFDLAIALAVLVANEKDEQREQLAGGLAERLFIGELTLDGRVRAVRGIIPMVMAARARSVKGRSTQRIPFTVGRVVVTEPRDGIVEAVVLVHNRVRTRAVAIRLEGTDARWRATAINVL